MYVSERRIDAEGARNITSQNSLTELGDVVWRLPGGLMARCWLSLDRVTHVHMLYVGICYLNYSILFKLYINLYLFIQYTVDYLIIIVCMLYCWV